MEFNADSLYVKEKRPVFVPQELVVAPSLVRQLPFEQAKAYVDSKTGKDHLSESQRARKQIHDTTLKALVGDAEADRRAQTVDDFQRLNADMLEKKATAKAQEEYAKKRWEEGMGKKRAIEAEERKAEMQKRKRVVLQKVQGRKIKKGKL